MEIAIGNPPLSESVGTGRSRYGRSRRTRNLAQRFEYRERAITGTSERPRTGREMTGRRIRSRPGADLSEHRCRRYGGSFAAPRPRLVSWRESESLFVLEIARPRAATHSTSVEAAGRRAAIQPSAGPPPARTSAGDRDIERRSVIPIDPDRADAGGRTRLPQRSTA